MCDGNNNNMYVGINGRILKTKQVVEKLLSPRNGMKMCADAPSRRRRRRRLQMWIHVYRMYF